jgi:hypothetical protein
MAADIGSLAPELEGHGLGLGIGRQELEKHVETLTIFFRSTPIPISFRYYH